MQRRSGRPSIPLRSRKSCSLLDSVPYERIASVWWKPLPGRKTAMSARKATNLDVLKILAMIGLSFLGGYTGDYPAFADTPSLSQQVAAIVQPQLDQYPD